MITVYDLGTAECLFDSNSSSTLPRDEFGFWSLSVLNADVRQAEKGLHRFHLRRALASKR